MTAKSFAAHSGPTQLKGSVSAVACRDTRFTNTKNQNNSIEYDKISSVLLIFF